MQNRSSGTRLACSLCGLLFAAIGCSGRSTPLDTSEGPDPSVDPGSEGEEALSLEGTWTATVSSPAFLSNSKPLRLALDSNARGTLLVGEQRLPPPTDPDVGSPPEAQADAAEASGMLLHLYEGIEYSLIDVERDGEDLYFELNALEAFEPSCAIAVPRVTDLGYRCLENWGGSVERSQEGKQCSMTDPDSGEVREVDCLMLFLCSVDPILGCRCTESSCRVSNSGAPIHAQFDLTLSEDGSRLVGSHQLDAITGDDSTLGNVTFVRETE